MCVWTVPLPSPQHLITSSLPIPTPSHASFPTPLQSPFLRTNARARSATLKTREQQDKEAKGGALLFSRSAAAGAPITTTVHK